MMQRRVAAISAGLSLGLALTGCGESSNAERVVSAEPPAASGEKSDVPKRRASSAEKAATPSPTPTASGDWWPELPAELASGLELPSDYVPATLEHPARNVPGPNISKEANEETIAGAQAFLDYRADAFWYAFQTGDTSLVREVTAESCDKCTDQFNRIDSIYSDGGWLAGGYEGGGILADSLIKGPGGFYALPVYTHSIGVKEIDEGKLQSQQNPFTTADRFNVNITFEEGRWLYLTGSFRNP